MFKNIILLVSTHLFKEKKIIIKKGKKNNFFFVLFLFSFNFRFFYVFCFLKSRNNYWNCAVFLFLLFSLVSLSTLADRQTVTITWFTLCAVIWWFVAQKSMKKFLFHTWMYVCVTENVCESTDICLSVYQTLVSACMFKCFSFFSVW